MKTKLLCAAALLCLSCGALAATDDWEAPGGGAKQVASGPSLIDELLEWFFGGDDAV